MSDSYLKNFSEQFTPTEGGYLYYPSRKAGGKLVTLAEYEKLLADRKRATSWTTMLKLFAVLFVLSILSILLELQYWDDLVALGGGFVLVGKLVWHIFAPNRLVRDRPDAVPPRTPSERRRVARSLTSWWIVCLAIWISGSWFALSLYGLGWTWYGWTIKAATGTLFVYNIWFGAGKYLGQQN